jgi:hypothetical protein
VPCRLRQTASDLWTWWCDCLILLGSVKSAVLYLCSCAVQSSIANSADLSRMAMAADPHLLTGISSSSDSESDDEPAPSLPECVQACVVGLPGSCRDRLLACLLQSTASFSSLVRSARCIVVAEVVVPYSAHVCQGRPRLDAVLEAACARDRKKYAFSFAHHKLQAALTERDAQVEAQQHDRSFPVCVLPTLQVFVDALLDHAAGALGDEELGLLVLSHNASPWEGSICAPPLAFLDTDTTSVRRLSALAWPMNNLLVHVDGDPTECHAVRTPFTFNVSRL